MALKSFTDGLQLFPLNALISTSSYADQIVDATGEAVALIFRSPVNGTVTGVSFRPNTVTTGDTISAELQTVGTASLLPSDTLFATGAGNSFSLTTTMVNTWQTVSLATPAAVSVGDRIACVVKRNDTGGAGNFRIGAISATAYINTNLAVKTTVWALGAPQFYPQIYPIFSSNAAPAGSSFTPYNQQAVAVSAGAAKDEVGLRFSLPFRARASGWMLAGSLSSGTSVVLRLYDSDGSTVMASQKLQGNEERNFIGAFLSATALAINTTYRIAAFVSAGAMNTYYQSMADVTANNIMNLGSLCYATARADGGAWSDNTAARYTIGILVDQFDDSSASGGAASGLAHIIGSF